MIVGHVARIKEKRNTYTFLGGGILKETDRFEDVDVHDNIKIDLKEMGWMLCILLVWGRRGTKCGLL